MFLHGLDHKYRHKYEISAVYHAFMTITQNLFDLQRLFWCQFEAIFVPNINKHPDY